MNKSARHAFLAALLALSLIAPKNADARDATVYIDLSTSPTLTREEHAALAEIGEPGNAAVSLEALRRNREYAIAQALQRDCGPETSRILIDRTLALNQTLFEAIGRVDARASANDASAALSAQGLPLRRSAVGAELALQIPSCAGQARSQTIVVRDGDTIDAILRAAFPADEPEAHYRLFLAANSNLLTARARERDACARLSEALALIRCLNDGLRAGDTVVITRPVFIGLRTSMLSQLERQISSPELAASLRRAAPGVRLVHGVAPPDASSPDCAPRAEPGQFPFDGEDVWTRLQAQARRAAEAPRAPSVIGLIDTGVNAPSQAFPATLFARKAEPDVNGQNISGTGNIRPFENDPEASHGTQVADLATGGSAFRARAGAAPAPPVQLRVYSLAVGETQSTISPTAALFGVEYLLRRDAGYAPVQARIVNLSLEQDDGEASWKNNVAGNEDIGLRANILFVAAAGNDRRYLETPNRVYPAALGGRANVITVAALDRTGHLAPFSNYGAEIVELAAPGCGVRALNERFAATDVWGTSFAAPQVSFAGALVAWLGGPSLNAAAIKQRLIYTADFNPDLAEDVRLGAMLNVARAISLYSDVLTIDGALRTGRLTTAAGTRMCPNQMIAARRILGRRLPDGRFEIRRYFVNETGRVSFHTCRGVVLAPGALSFHDDASGRDTDLTTLASFDVALRN